MLKRKIRFFFLRALFIFQIILLILIIFLLIWIFYFDGKKIITDFYHAKSSKLFSESGLDIGEIYISGNKKVSNRFIQKTIEESFGEYKPNMVKLDLGKISQDLKENGWIEEVVIKKKLPDKLAVVIQERKPAAIHQNGDEIFLIDRLGNKITNSFGEEYNYLPQITSELNKDHIIEIFQILDKYPSLKNEVDAIVRIGKRRWDFITKNELTIKLPESDLKQTIDKFMTINRDKNLLAKDLRYIDLRIEGQMVLGINNNDGKLEESIFDVLENN